MPITLNEPTVGERIPVLKRRALGQSFTGALILTDQRDSQKKNDLTGAMEPVLKPNGKARQELIVRLVTITSTMPAGIGDDEDVRQRAVILGDGDGFGNWFHAVYSTHVERGNLHMCLIYFQHLFSLAKWL